MKKSIYCLSSLTARQNSSPDTPYSHAKRKKIGTIIVLALFLFIPASAYSLDFGSIMNDVGSAVKSGMNKTEENVSQILSKDEGSATEKQQSAKPAKTEPQEISEKSTTDKKPESQFAKGTSATSSPAPAKGSLFSRDPINPDNPPAPVASFTAGDNIYGMLKASKPWKELNKNNNYIIVWLYIDGQQKVYKSVGL